METGEAPVALIARDGFGEVVVIAPELAAWRSAAGVWSSDFEGRGTMEDLANDFAPIADPAQISALVNEARDALVS